MSFSVAVRINLLLSFTHTHARLSSTSSAFWCCLYATSFSNIGNTRVNIFLLYSVHRRIVVTHKFLIAICRSALKESTSREKNVLKMDKLQ